MDGATLHVAVQTTPRKGLREALEQINTPQGTAVAWHLNTEHVTRSRHRHVKDETSELMSKGVRRKRLHETITTNDM